VALGALVDDRTTAGTARSTSSVDWRHLFELLTADRSVYAELKNLCVWTKTNGGMGSLYRSQHELVAVSKKGSAPHINNVELGGHGALPHQCVGLRGHEQLRPRSATRRLHASDREARSL